MLLAMTSRLSRTCCAVTLGPKQYHEHQPVGGVRACSGGWRAARRPATSASRRERSAPDVTRRSSSTQVSPGPSERPSVSTTARSVILAGSRGAISNRPLNFAHDVNAHSVVSPSGGVSVSRP